MVSVWHQSTARAIREKVVLMRSNGSRDTLMSHTEHSVQRRFTVEPQQQQQQQGPSGPWEEMQNMVKIYFMSWKNWLWALKI